MMARTYPDRGYLFLRPPSPPPPPLPQVWPFSLQNDGFWEKKVGEPFEERDPEALELLRALIRVVMMRHSKSQVMITITRVYFSFSARILTSSL